jgi:hypothetical protein
MRYDPTKDESTSTGGSKFKTLGAGKKVVHGLSFERWTAKSGTPMLKVWFVVLKDMTSNGDEGEVTSRNFPLTPNALPIWGRFCKAVGYMKAHDTDDDAEIENIISKGAVICEIVEEKYNEKVSLKPDNFSPYRGSEDPEWDALLERGHASVGRIRAAIAAKSGGSPSNGSPAPRNSAPSQGKAPAFDDTIPF